MKIAEVGRRYGLTTDTLRYYERIGLLGKVPRSETGIRNYSELNCKVIEFVKCLRDADVPIDVISEYMQLAFSDAETSNRQKQMLVVQRDALKDRIDAYKSALDKINYLVNNFDEISVMTRSLRLEEKEADQDPDQA